MKIVEKPWGREEWLVFGEGAKYVAKFLVINAGHRLSYQYHNVKHETMCLVYGKVKFTLENENGEIEDKIVMPGEYRIIPPGRKHRMEAIEDSKFFEVSTLELDDVVRVEDDYKR